MGTPRKRKPTSDLQKFGTQGGEHKDPTELITPKPVPFEYKPTTNSYVAPGYEVCRSPLPGGGNEIRLTRAARRGQALFLLSPETNAEMCSKTHTAQVHGLLIDGKPDAGCMVAANGLGLGMLANEPTDTPPNHILHNGFLVLVEDAPAGTFVRWSPVVVWERIPRPVRISSSRPRRPQT